MQEIITIEEKMGVNKIPPKAKVETSNDQYVNPKSNTIM